MARPYKQGLDYFPLDVGFYEDSKIEDLIIESGALGVTIYLLILTLVYKNGYYLKISYDDLAKQIFRKLRNKSLTKVEKVAEVIQQIARLELISSRLGANGVITSKAIQRQWLLCVSRRKNIEKNEYWLLEESEENELSRDFQEEPIQRKNKEKLINVDNNSVNATITPINDDNNTQSKSKSIYINNINNINSVKLPNFNYFTLYLMKKNYIDQYDEDIAKYDLFLSDIATHYSYRDIIECLNYCVNQMMKRKIKNISYFKKAMLKGLNRNRNNINILDEIKKGVDDGKYKIKSD